MPTLNDLITEIKAIQDAIELVEVKGYANREYLNFAYSKCANLISVLKKTIEQLESNQNGSVNESEPKEG